MSGIKILVKNRKAFHDYEIVESYEAGIVLSGTEVKSLRLGKANLSEGWADVEKGELFLNEVHISPYSHGNIYNHEEARRRKLLMKKSQIHNIGALVETKGLTLIPLKLYFKGEYVKVEIGLGRGKKYHDKRESEKKKDANREISRALNSRK